MIEAIELTSTRRSRGAAGGAVEKVSFDVYPGQVTALLGAPGTGKSTVLRLMVELEPGGGRTLFGGRPYRALRPAVREVGLALNPDAVHPGRTVQAHLQLYSAAGGVPKARIAEVLEVAGLSTQATVRCGRLDPAQRQRLSIAAALLGDPAALILDEPHALDSHGMSWFHALIRAYAAQGRTVLVAATDPDTLCGTADHVVILRRDEHDGISRVIASRSAAEVFDERRVTVVQVRSPQAARLAAALESEGARLAPAGPGALQVRGLDRARIGEVAHVAGICLHELSEIGHDEDVFGLRPVPRQKELLPGLNRAEVRWRAGVRLVTEEIEEIEEIEEAEVIESAEQPATAGVGGVTVADAGEVSAGADTQALQGSIDSARQAGWRSQSSEWSGLKTSGMRAEQASAVRADSQPDAAAEEAASGPASIAEQFSSPSEVPTPSIESLGFERSAEAATTAVAAETASSAQLDEGLAWVKLAEAPSAAETASPTQLDEAWASVKSVEATGAAETASSAQSDEGLASMKSVEAPGAEAASPAQSPEASASVSPAKSPEAPTPKSPAEGPALRRSTSFGLRWGRSRTAALRPAAQQSSAPAPVPTQPAVPFTVAASAAMADSAEDGMTPWRAVTARASQQSQQQASVAEAAPAEQEASA